MIEKLVRWLFPTFFQEMRERTALLKDMRERQLSFARLLYQQGNQLKRGIEQIAEEQKVARSLAEASTRQSSDNLVAATSALLDAIERRETAARAASTELARQLFAQGKEQGEILEAIVVEDRAIALLNEFEARRRMDRLIALESICLQILECQPLARRQDAFPSQQESQDKQFPMQSTDLSWPRRSKSQ